MSTNSSTNSTGIHAHNISHPEDTTPDSQKNENLEYDSGTHEQNAWQENLSKNSQKQYGPIFFILPSVALLLVWTAFILPMKEGHESSTLLELGAWIMKKTESWGAIIWLLLPFLLIFIILLISIVIFPKKSISTITKFFTNIFGGIAILILFKLADSPLEYLGMFFKKNDNSLWHSLKQIFRENVEFWNLSTLFVGAAVIIVWYLYLVNSRK